MDFLPKFCFEFFKQDIRHYVEILYPPFGSTSKEERMLVSLEICSRLDTRSQKKGSQCVVARVFDYIIYTPNCRNVVIEKSKKQKPK